MARLAFLLRSLLLLSALASLCFTLDQTKPIMSISIAENNNFTVIDEETSAADLGVPVAKEKENVDERFWIAFFKAFSIIFVSEIADKSFIMVLYFTIACKKINSIFILLISALALIVMCVLSVAVGYAMPLLLNKSILEWVAIVVFTFFGFFSIYEGTKMSYGDTVNKKVQIAAHVGIKKADSHDDEVLSNEAEELKKGLLHHAADHEHKPTLHEDDNLEISEVNKEDDALFNSSFCLSMWTMFSMVVISEWGDKTMFSTIVIASVFNVYGVFFGACVSYILTCLIAVLAGKFFGKYLNEKIMCYIGGVIFLGFAIQYIVEKFFL